MDGADDLLRANEGVPQGSPLRDAVLKDQSLHFPANQNGERRTNAPAQKAEPSYTLEVSLNGLSVPLTSWWSLLMTTGA